MVTGRGGYYPLFLRNILSNIIIIIYYHIIITPRSIRIKVFGYATFFIILRYQFFFSNSNNGCVTRSYLTDNNMCIMFSTIYEVRPYKMWKLRLMAMVTGWGDYDNAQP